MGSLLVLQKYCNCILIVLILILCFSYFVSELIACYSSLWFRTRSIELGGKRSTLTNVKPFHYDYDSVPSGFLISLVGNTQT